jgi:hypothetical protein
MSREVHSLADFKRFLALPGATVQVIQNDWTDPVKVSHPIRPKTAEYWQPKGVSKLQSNGVWFTTGWLAYPKAAHVRFTGDTAVLDMNQDGMFTHVLVYALSLVESRAASTPGE